MADAVDSKSTEGNLVRVQVSSPAYRKSLWMLILFEPVRRRVRCGGGGRYFFAGFCFFIALMYPAITTISEIPC